jgi:hypothetical protein
MATGCRAPAEPPSATIGDGGKDAGGIQAGAGPVTGEAGASGEHREPVFEVGTDTQDPAAPEGGSGTGEEPGEPGGRPSAVRDPHAGEAVAGAESDPACGKQLDGTLCGSNMTPPGPDGARYFCSSGEIIAQAACPGPCDIETNACVQSGGTGGGMGETNLFTLLRCRACYATLCRAELVACDADPLCTAHLECYESCSLENVCYSTCDSVFAAEPRLGALNKCVGRTGCVNKCPRE